MIQISTSPRFQKNFDVPTAEEANAKQLPRALSSDAPAGPSGPHHGSEMARGSHTLHEKDKNPDHQALFLRLHRSLGIDEKVPLRIDFHRQYAVQQGAPDAMFGEVLHFFSVSSSQKVHASGMVRSFFTNQAIAYDNDSVLLSSEQKNELKRVLDDSAPPAGFEHNRRLVSLNLPEFFAKGSLMLPPADPTLSPLESHYHLHQGKEQTRAGGSQGPLPLLDESAKNSMLDELREGRRFDRQVSSLFGTTEVSLHCRFPTPSGGEERRVYIADAREPLSTTLKKIQDESPLQKDFIVEDIRLRLGPPVTEGQRGPSPRRLPLGSRSTHESAPLERQPRLDENPLAGATEGGKVSISPTQVANAIILREEKFSQKCSGDLYLFPTEPSPISPKTGARELSSPDRQSRLLSQPGQGAPSTGQVITPLGNTFDATREFLRHKTPMNIGDPIHVLGGGQVSREVESNWTLILPERKPGESEKSETKRARSFLRNAPAQLKEEFGAGQESNSEGEPLILPKAIP